MADTGRRMTDAEFRRLRAKIKGVYQEAYEDIYKKNLDFVKRHERKETRYRKMVDEGKLSKADFDAWMRGQVFQGKQWEAKRKQMEATLLHADEMAMDMINGSRVRVFADNANYIGYEIEQHGRIDSGFGLYDENTVRRLLIEEPDLLPPRKVGKDKSYQWYNCTIQNAATQGIIQGEKLYDIAKRIAQATGEANMNAMLRNARTMHTGAENAGRIEGMHQAQRLGIRVKKKWLAFLDNHTRDSHRTLDGKTAEVDEPFKSPLGKIMFPGDPNAESPADVWNCRCTLTYVYPEYPDSMAQRRDNITGEIIENMSYREWEAMKRGESEAPKEPEIKIPEFEPAKTRKEAEEYAGRFADNVSYNGLSVDNCNAINQQLNELTTKYPINKLNSIEQKRMSAVMSASANRLNIDGKKLGSVLDNGLEDFKKSQEDARRQIEDIKARFAGKAKLPFSAQSTIDKLAEKLKFTRYGVHESYENHVKCTVTHEYGHILSDQYFGMINKDSANPNYKTNWGLAGRSRKWDEVFQQARKTGDIYGISEYANRNSHEFFAECFAAREMGEKLPDYIESLMKETLEDGIM